MRIHYTEWFNSGISQFKCLQYDSTWEFPNYKKCSSKNLSIDLLVKATHMVNLCILYLWKSLIISHFRPRSPDTFVGEIKRKNVAPEVHTPWCHPNIEP